MRHLNEKRFKSQKNITEHVVTLPFYSYFHGSRFASRWKVIISYIENPLWYLQNQQVFVGVQPENREEWRIDANSGGRGEYCQCNVDIITINQRSKLESLRGIKIAILINLERVTFFDFIYFGEEAEGTLTIHTITVFFYTRIKIGKAF